MITTYFTKVVIRFNPFAPSARPARLFLSRLPSASKGSLAIDCKVLGKNSSPNEKPKIEVTFKDKHVMEADPEKMAFKELTEHFNTHSRRLQLKQAISD